MGHTDFMNSLQSKLPKILWMLSGSCEYERKRSARENDASNIRTTTRETYSTSLGNHPLLSANVVAGGVSRASRCASMEHMFSIGNRLVEQLEVIQSDG
ncbi:hypothetical protein TNCV_1447601 [Trichonephila clavipes]|nr:hypothetical protein TNCV_1447601 [Trichonephila clavipes]